MVLPSSWALSDKEAVDVRLMAERGWTILADGTPGLFDAHGKLRSKGALESLFAPAAMSAVRCAGGPPKSAPGEIARYASDRLRASPDPAWPAWLAQQLGNMRPEITVPAAARVRVHRFTLGRARLVAFERNVDYHMSEDLKQAGGNETLEKPVEIQAKLTGQPACIYDLRTGKYLGRADHIHLTLDPWEPSLFALTSEPLPAGEVVDLLGH
jgi:hypothetical protein